MPQVKPEIKFMGQELISITDEVAFPCPFCKFPLEFQLSESLDKLEHIFNCIQCRKRFTVTKF